MGLMIAAQIDQCPRCQAFEFVQANETSDTWSCLLCGFIRSEEGDIPLPHYCLRYRVDQIELDIENIHGNLPIDDLMESELWIRAREAEGYQIFSCVLVNDQGHVVWLRGSPDEWNFGTG